MQDTLPAPYAYGDRGLEEFAQGIKYDPTRQGQRPTYPISYSFWFLVCRVVADDLMESYMAAIPRKVRLLLGQDSLAPASILALDGDWKHHHKSKGIYVGLPYVHLLEEIMMIILQSCPPPQRNSRFMNIT